eukprot:scaffold13395_cov140-Cylindrotheca_fusiformis.AAC.1
MDGWRLVLRGCTWKVLVFCACANLRSRKVHSSVRARTSMTPLVRQIHHTGRKCAPWSATMQRCRGFRI